MTAGGVRLPSSRNASAVLAAPALTIRSVRTTAVHVPMKRALGTSARRMDIAPLVLIDLETEEGVTGRAYVFCYLPAATTAVAAIVHEAAAHVKGDRVDAILLRAKLERHFRLLGVRGMVTMALAGLDGACWDARAVAAGVPLVSLLGGSVRPVRAYNSNGLSIREPGAGSRDPWPALADEAEELAADGHFSAIKLRLGYPTLAEDLAAVRAVRTRVSADIVVMSDYNQALSVDEALERGRALDGEGLAWIEEPIDHEDYEGSALLARELATPIQIGENFDGPGAMADALAANACDDVMPDFARIGGVSGWRDAAIMAETAGMQMSSHLYPEFSAHLLAVTPTCHWLEYVDWAAPILKQPIEIRDGHAIIPNRPGAGIEWNDEAVARYRA
jgi:mandelate racemase